ncbi:MAG: hypothetical protein HY343_02570 [Lentisphaerae bacterium]|nr:hypothetical protein [Lentisphaerota bacterium]
MNISVIAPVSRAFESVKAILFCPFNMTKWFGMGFTAWLALAPPGGGGLPLNVANFWNKPESEAVELVDATTGWVQSHWTFVLGLAALGVVLSVVVGLVMIWISSRSKFMFLDNVVNNRGEIRAPWREYRKEGNSLFLFNLALGVAAMLILALVAITLALVAAPDIQRRVFQFNALAALVLGSLFLAAFLLALGVLTVFLDDFVVPIMAKNACRVRRAWGLFFAVFNAHKGSFILYVLFRYVLQMAAGFIVLGVACLTCCLALIPYLGTVIFLPVLVFFRCYALYFLEQFGEDYRLFPPAAASDPPPLSMAPGT